jgi:hypothetical protein
MKMQVVINIDEAIYKRILPYKDLPIISNLCNDYPEITHTIANGVPLPSGHGKLGDLDKVADRLEVLRDGWNRYGNEYESGKYDGYDCALDEVMDAPTIIEADRSEEDG